MHVSPTCLQSTMVDLKISVGKTESLPIPPSSRLKKSTTLPGSLQQACLNGDLPNPPEQRASLRRSSGFRRSHSPRNLRSAPNSPVLPSAVSSQQFQSSAREPSLSKSLTLQVNRDHSLDNVMMRKQSDDLVVRRVEESERKDNQKWSLFQLLRREKSSSAEEILRQNTTEEALKTEKSCSAEVLRHGSAEELKSSSDFARGATIGQFKNYRSGSVDELLRHNRQSRDQANQQRRWGIVGLTSRSIDCLYSERGGSASTEEEEWRGSILDRKHSIHGLEEENDRLRSECAHLRRTIQRMSEQEKERERREGHQRQLECLKLERLLSQQREDALRMELELRSELGQLQQSLDSILRQACTPQVPPAEVYSREVDFWKVDRNEVTLGSQIGGGAWGYISVGKFREQAVAVKLPYPQILTRHTYARLQREVGIMAKVRHPNLLLFIAAVFDEKAETLTAPPMIITELLDTDLRSAYNRKLVKPSSRFSIFHDVARALNYLHTQREPIIHRDVSAPNVLLEALANGRWKAKLSDFGSANLLRLACTMGEGAIIYAAPETFPPQARSPLSPTFPQSTKVDVYSFGILVCEVMTNQMPSPDQLKVMLEEVRGLEVRGLWPSMHTLIEACTSYSPEDRPSMLEVLNKLSSKRIEGCIGTS